MSLLVVVGFIVARWVNTGAGAGSSEHCESKRKPSQDLLCAYGETQYAVELEEGSHKPPTGRGLADQKECVSSAIPVLIYSKELFILTAFQI